MLSSPNLSVILNLAIVFSELWGSASAHPNPPFKRSTARSLNSQFIHVKLLRVSGEELQVYNPPTKFETFGVGGSSTSLSKRADIQFTELAATYFSDKTGLNSTSDFIVRSSVTDDVSKYTYLQQKLNGLPVANAVGNVAVNVNNNIASFSSNFFKKPVNIAPPGGTISVEEATRIAETYWQGTSYMTPRLEYFLSGDDNAVLTRVIGVRNNDHSGEVFVNAHDRTIVNFNDFTSHASYRAIPIGQQYSRSGFTLISNPENPSASPRGWVLNGTTSGPNVVAYKGTVAGTAKETSPGIFNYTWDESTDPTTATNAAAAIVNAFYVVNAIHDITYLYGFTEGKYNFQGNDPIQISVQDSQDTDNAGFFTEPDGTPSQMQLYLYTATTPERDPAVANEIVAHEAAHGLTGRLTGGGTAACLQGGEARGLGEGWSDVFADWLEQSSRPLKDWTFGPWVSGNPGGLRTYPYSTSKATNPQMYHDIFQYVIVPGFPHEVGQVWGNILHNVLAALVDAKDLSPNFKTNANGSEGNVVFMRLFVDSLSIQPCEPDFVMARDAWIQADASRYQGTHNCILWKAFASRGLGMNAIDYNDDSTVPAGC